MEVLAETREQLYLRLQGTLAKVWLSEVHVVAGILGRLEGWKGPYPLGKHL